MENIVLIYLIVFVIYLIFLRLSYIKIEKLILKLVNKSKTKLDDIILEKLKKPLFYLFAFLGLIIEVKVINLNNEIKDLIIKISTSFIYLILAFISYRLFYILIDYWAKKQKDKELLGSFVSFLKSIFLITFFIIAIFQILTLWNIDITPLLASAGVISLAVALAAQNFLSNFFGGVNLFLDKTLKVGDRVKINGKYLIVEEVNIRSTKFRTLENTLIIIPNSVLSSSEIENITEPKEHKNVRIKISVAYGSDVKKVKEILKKVAKENSYYVKDSEIEVYFYELGDYSLNFLVVFKVKDASEIWPAKVEYIEKVYEELQKNNIEIPFPTQTVYCKKQ